MAIKIPPEKVRQHRTAIRRYVAENLEQEIGDLKADLLLDFFVKEIGPGIYNRAIANAQAYFQGRVTDLESECYEPEVDYWARSSRVGKGK